MIFDILLVDRGFDSRKGRHEVVHAHIRAHKFAWIHIHNSHILAHRIGGIGWDPTAFRCLSEPLTGLAFSHWHHQRLVYYDRNIRTGVTL